MAKKDSNSSQGKDEKEEDIETTESEVEEEDLEDDADTDEEEEDLSDEEEEESDEEHSDNEIDVDEELEAEEKLGKPDPKKAHKRIKDKAADEDADEDEDDKPLSRREARELLERQNREAQEGRAFDFARRLSASDKEAELVVMKWKNRRFPDGLPLKAQVEEAYVITHGKRMIAQRNEALRGLKNKGGVRNDPATTHRDNRESPAKAQPKMPPQDVAAIEASGFKWVPKHGRFEKKLKNGNLLVKYPGKDVHSAS